MPCLSQKACARMDTWLPLSTKATGTEADEPPCSCSSQLLVRKSWGAMFDAALDRNSESAALQLEGSAGEASGGAHAGRQPGGVVSPGVGRSHPLG